VSQKKFSDTIYFPIQVSDISSFSFKSIYPRQSCSNMDNTYG